MCTVRLPSRIWIKNLQLGIACARKARSYVLYGSKGSGQALYGSKGSKLGIIWLERLGACLERLRAIAVYINGVHLRTQSFSCCPLRRSDQYIKFEFEFNLMN